MEWKERLERIRTRIERERDEIRLKVSLAKMDARDEMAGMERKWETFKARMSEVELSDVTEEVREAADKLAGELREGYDILRAKIGEHTGKGREEGTPEEDAESVYTMGYGEEFRRVLERRNAQSHAAHLLPHLRPGMRLLDFGCGPGTISVGLAKAVAPGEFHGIDVEESQVDLARRTARAAGCENVEFRMGSVTDLPFDDGWFDVAHCNAVLMHVPDIRAALNELKRVLKPGGIVSVQELITAASFSAPDFGNLNGMFDTFAKVLSATGGHPQLGREIKNVLYEAGFVDVESSLSFEVFDSTEDRALFHGFVRDWFFASDMVTAATQNGFATPRQFEGWRRSVDKWRDHPGALATFAWGGALGRKA